VPFVIGKKFAKAADILAEAGLNAEENPSGFPFGRDNGTVVRQNPEANSMVDPGETITLDTF
jgi:Uncharacterized protein conserved in bacteria